MLCQILSRPNVTSEHKRHIRCCFLFNLSHKCQMLGNQFYLIIIIYLYFDGTSSHFYNSLLQGWKTFLMVEVDLVMFWWIAVVFKFLVMAFKWLNPCDSSSIRPFTNLFILNSENASKWSMKFRQVILWWNYELHRAG